MVTAKAALHSFLRCLRHHPRSLSRQEWRGVQGVLVSLVFMLLEQPSSMDPMTCDGTPDASRQRFVREQGLIDLLVTILQETFQKGRFDVRWLTPVIVLHAVAEFGVGVSRMFARTIASVVPLSDWSFAD